MATLSVLSIKSCDIEECLCGVGKCDVLIHNCICGWMPATDCRAKTHECGCNLDSFNCQASIHDKCICEYYPMYCRLTFKNEHICCCSNSISKYKIDPTMCKAIGKHHCSCSLHKNPMKCLADKFNHHCICLYIKGTTQKCSARIHTKLG